MSVGYWWLRAHDPKPFAANERASPIPADACAAAGIVRTLRRSARTAVTPLAIAGSTAAEIATITGRSLRDLRAILDANYLHRTPAIAESAMRKLETRPTVVPDVLIWNTVTY